jgi:hypothetical protein
MNDDQGRSRELRPQADAVGVELDRRGASEVSLDARMRRRRAGATGHRGPFRRGTGLSAPFGDGLRGRSLVRSTPASCRSGGCG